MINCHATSIIYVKKNVQTINLIKFFVNNKKAFVLDQFVKLEKLEEI